MLNSNRAPPIKTFIEVEFPNRFSIARHWGGIGVQLRSKTSAEGAKKTAVQGFFVREDTAERRGLQRKPNTTPVPIRS